MVGADNLVCRADHDHVEMGRYFWWRGPPPRRSQTSTQTAQSFSPRFSRFPSAPGACVPSSIAFTPPLAYRAAVLSLISVLTEAHRHETSDKKQNKHERPVASIHTVARTLGVEKTELYKTLPASLKTRAGLLAAARQGAAAFVGLNLAAFVLVMILAHGADPEGVGSNW